MINWKDGIKINDAYIDENGNFIEAEYEGETPLCAANLNLMQEIKTDSVILAKDTVITNGYEVTLPLKYQVGNNSLEVRIRKLSTNSCNRYKRWTL